MNMDEIYELFTWDAAFSAEEYDVRVKTGIAEAGKLRNIYPFIQPIIAGRNNKSVWEPCAKVVALKSDADLEPFFFLLLEWLKDMNWPGADIIFDRLSRIPFQKMEKALDYCRNCAIKDNDEIWLAVLDKLRNNLK